MGRFAPTPSGDLHIGSLVAAVASAADAKHVGGQHRIRIDDIDPPRVVNGSIDRIQQALLHYRIPTDGDTLYQSECIEQYRCALHQLAQLDVLFACSCSRKTLKNGSVCVSSCRSVRIDTSDISIAEHLRRLCGNAAIRLDTSSSAVPISINVVDAVQTPLFIEHISQLGTPVLWRKDGYVSYLLATAVNDSDGITDVIRGADLWLETPTQQLLIQLLKRRVPRWGHVPCAVDQRLQKLGKQTRAASILPTAAGQTTLKSVRQPDRLALLNKVWTFLGQKPSKCGSLDEFWNHAAAHWSLDNIPALQSQLIE